jgi:hypothetical protein
MSCEIGGMTRRRLFSEDPTVIDGSFSVVRSLDFATNQGLEV